MKKLENQVVLVTGGASGLGRAIVERFVSEGARVGVLDRSADRIAEIRDALGDAVMGFQGDVTSYEDNLRAVNGLVAQFGRLDCAIGNAGIWDFKTALVDLSEDKLSSAFDELFAVNVKGYLLLAKAALKALVESRGSLIFTASNASFRSDGGGVLYTASKHAIRGIVTQLAFELAPFVRVNAVAPGGMITNLSGVKSLGLSEATIPAEPFVEMARHVVPIGHLPTPADYTGAYVFFASREDNLPATGTVLRHDGGLAVQGFIDCRGGAGLLEKLSINQETVA